MNLGSFPSGSNATAVWQDQCPSASTLSPVSGEPEMILTASPFDASDGTSTSDAISAPTRVFRCAGAEHSEPATETVLKERIYLSSSKLLGLQHLGIL